MKVHWIWALTAVLAVASGGATVRAADPIEAARDEGTSVLQTSHAKADAKVDTKGGGAKLGDLDCAKGELGKGVACDELVPLELMSGDVLGFRIGGWTQVGYHSQNSANGLGYADFFNRYEDHVALHQQWLFAERVADGRCGWDWGFRLDFMYGIDANNTQAFGNHPGKWDFQNGFDHGEYGFAIPQVYAELAYGDLSVKVGHFFRLGGYEVVAAPENFFYSHSFTMNSEPFTHTGAVATYNATDRMTLYGGYTLGWDTGFDQLGNGNNFLGGVSYALTEDIKLTYMATAGDFGWLGNRAYSHSFVADVTLTEKLNYVFQSDLLRGEELGVDHVGVNQYLFYHLNDCWAFGARVEWWAPEGESGYEATFGINWKPHTNFVMRPEIKREWIPVADYRETILGVDAIVTY